MENRVVEVLMALLAIRNLHREEADRLGSRMHDLMEENLSIITKINDNHNAELEDVMTTANIAGTMSAITDQLKFMNDELILINNLIEAITGAKNEEA